MYIQYPQSKFTILFSHGNATDIGCMRDHLIDMAMKLEASVVCYDYTGYGLSSGKPSVNATLQDAEAVFQHMTQVYGLKPEQIVLYGQSLGSGPTLHLAAKFPVRGVVLHSGLTSGLRVIRNVESTHWFDIFPNIDVIKHVNSPVFVIHGTQDQEIPLHHGQMLASAAPNKYQPWYVDGAGHNNIEVQWRETLFQQLLDFVHFLEQPAVHA